MHGDYDTSEMDRELEDIVSQMHKEKLSDRKAHIVKMTRYLLLTHICVIGLIVIMTLIAMLFF